MTYPGGKNGSGSYQRIINQMPPHKVYVEPFCGSGAVLRAKKPATRNFAMDIDLSALNLARDLAGDRSDITWLRKSALELLPEWQRAGEITDKWFIYLDPPYVHSTRCRADMYAFEMDDEAHEALLAFAKATDAMVAISGYRSELYDSHLKNWRRIDYMTQTRGGMKPESLWMNYPEPVQLHDYQYLGEDFRDRERIKKKKNRFKHRFETMDRLERLAIVEVVMDVVEKV